MYCIPSRSYAVVTPLFGWLKEKSCCAKDLTLGGLTLSLCHLQSPHPGQHLLEAPPGHMALLLPKVIPYFVEDMSWRWYSKKTTHVTNYPSLQIRNCSSLTLYVQPPQVSQQVRPQSDQIRSTDYTTELAIPPPMLEAEGLILKQGAEVLPLTFNMHN